MHGVLGLTLVVFVRPVGEDAQEVKPRLMLRAVQLSAEEWKGGQQQRGESVGESSVKALRRSCEACGGSEMM
jgi:hypothetical protein